jgi:hypothetical protein
MGVFPTEGPRPGTIDDFLALSDLSAPDFILQLESFAQSNVPALLMYFGRAHHQKLYAH